MLELGTRLPTQADLRGQGSVPPLAASCCYLGPLCLRAVPSFQPSTYELDPNPYLKKKLGVYRHSFGFSGG